MKYFIYILTSLCLFSFNFSAHCQKIYGNEWIQPTNTYFKLKLAKDGFYRIPAHLIKSNTFSYKNIYPKTIKLFHMGIEQYLFVHDGNDGKLDSLDFIEFYGKKNSGETDAPLYSSTNSQLNKGYSLYTDTNYYYLTISSDTISKRYTNLVTPNSYGTNSSTFIHQTDLYLSETYSLGEELTEFGGNYSEYTLGEGYVGSIINLNGKNIRTISTPKAQSTNYQPYLEFCLLGRSNASSNFSYNHHYTISISSDNITFRKLKDIYWNGYDKIIDTVNLSFSDIGISTYIQVQNINDLNIASDAISPVYYKLFYSRNFDLNNSKSLFFLNDRSIDSTFIKFSNFGGTVPLIYDLKNGIRIRGKQTNKEVQIFLPPSNFKQEVILNDSSNFTLLVPELINMNFDLKDTKNINYLIIAGKKLISSSQAFSEFKQTQGFRTKLVFAEDLYNFFYYGHHHPMAIRNYLDFIVNVNNDSIPFLLFIGKAQSTPRMRSSLNAIRDLVPAYGVPMSDVMYSSFLKSNQYQPLFHTGRLSCETDQQVFHYLNKLKEYSASNNELYRKHHLHISGGDDLQQTTLWSGFMRGFENIAGGVFLGASTINYLKNINEPVTDQLKAKIIKEINKGVGLVSFFGHGAALITEINFGQPEEHANKGKYPLYILNGCSIGNPSNDISLGEKYIHAKDKGAIAWLGTTDEGFPTQLNVFTRNFYTQNFNKNYGKSIGENISKAISDFQSQDLTPVGKAHLRQYLLQGDPSISTYSPSLPDYVTTPTSLKLKETTINSKSDSLTLVFSYYNQGKAIKDSILIEVIETNSSGVSRIVKLLKVLPALYSDTLLLVVKKGNLPFIGKLNYQVKINPSFEIDELNVTNNTVSLELFIPELGVVGIYPPNLSIVSRVPITYIAQSNSTSSVNNEFIFEIDTVINFNSPFKINSGVVKTNFFANFTPTISYKKNQVYYWRVRFNLPLEQGGEWSNYSFTYLPNELTGTAFSNNEQLLQYANFEKIIYDTIAKKFTYALNAFGVAALTRGDDLVTSEDRNFTFYPGGKAGFLGTSYVGITLCVLNPLSMNLYSPISKYNFQNSPGQYSGQFLFNTNKTEDIDSLVTFLQSIPQGYYVMGLNGRSINLKNLTSAAVLAFRNCGVNFINTVEPGYPYVFFGKKGLMPSEAEEYFADPSSTTPPRSQFLRVEKEYYTPWNTGTYHIESIGPVKSWNQLKINTNQDLSDSINLRLNFYNLRGLDTILRIYKIQSLDSINLKGISAIQFPYLKISIETFDAENKSLANINQIICTYETLPEGSIHPTEGFTINNYNLEEGDSLKMNYRYYNISDKNIDDLLVTYQLRLENNQLETFIDTIKTTLLPTAFISLSKIIPTLHKSGNNQLTIIVNPLNTSDQYEFNNFFQLNFKVKEDNKNPSLNVFVNGKRIKTGEIITPSPTFKIYLKDENKFRKLNDTSFINLFISDPNSLTLKKVPYSNECIFIGPSADKNEAMVKFTPSAPFKDGKYLLKVNAQDANGNHSGKDDYQINFEVINESSLTRFLPYPNPFTDKVQFAYTLTGSEIPDYIRIQIFTPSGKLVKTITEREFGKMMIGVNLSEYTWDGKDDFGAKLGRGVYLYRVDTRIKGQKIKLRTTSGDVFFENGFGKIYLL